MSDDEVELEACEIVNERGLDDPAMELFEENTSEGEFDSLTDVVVTGTITRAVCID